ncbi:MAG: type II toxin-antitoxin system prevent-host-death family antitoxin [Bacteroidales bacterium]|nr:type II toxin-antitoxin system prevent-host-death family antitoxin [Bacteroidales bacterium]
MTILGEMIKIVKKMRGVNIEATATEVNNKFGKFSDIARNEPVIVVKTGRKVVVLIAFEEYERLTQIEDAYWGEKAVRAEAGGYVGSEESMAFIKAKHA